MEKYGRDLSGIEIAGTSALIIRDGIKNDLKILDKLDHIISTMYDKFYFEPMKFDYIIVTFLYGTQLTLIPNYNRVKTDGYDGRKYLGIGLELDAKIMRWCDTNDLGLMKEIFMIATCEAVLHALCKYNLPTNSVEMIRAQYTTIPRTISECETRSFGAQIKNQSK